MISKELPQRNVRAQAGFNQVCEVEFRVRTVKYAMSHLSKIIFFTPAKNFNFGICDNVLYHINYLRLQLCSYFRMKIRCAN